MKLKIAAALVVVLTMIGCGISEETRKVKLYQSELGTMLGREDRAVRKQIKESYQFLLLDRWKAENPGPETVMKNNYRVHGFSKEEAREEFGIPGIYEVEVYQKKQAAETARIEQINQMGQTIPDTRHTMTNEYYTYIRVVFRDAALIRVDVWRR
jgi:hypothetical protein